MFNLLRHRLVYVFTLLTLFSQLVFANPNLMVPKENTDRHNSAMSLYDIDYQQLETVSVKSCSSRSDNKHDHSTNSKTHHCDGHNACQSDCDNCLYISVADSLLMQKPWKSQRQPDNAIVTALPYFKSIFTSQQLRPPIA